MAKIYESLLSRNILREKRRHSFDRQRENKNVATIGTLLDPVSYTHLTLPTKLEV